MKKQEKNNHASEKADLTNREDLSIAVMNLISLEEHLAFTAMKTSKQEYLTILGAVRKLRVKLLRKLVVNTEGELWCISKHLLAATMRSMEVATKYVGKDNAAAMELEKTAFDLYSLFWLLQNTDEEGTNKELKEKKIDISVKGG